MAKYIRRVLIVVVIVLGIFTAFQFKNYQKKIEIRDDAMLYFEEHDYKKAISYLEEGRKHMTIFDGGLDLDMTSYLAESYYQLGDYESSLKVCNEILDKNSNNQNIYLLKGENYLAMDDTETAVSTYKDGWKNTKSFTFLEKICDSYMDNGDFEQALKYAKEGAESSGKNAAEFLFKEIVIYENANDYASAYENAEKYVELYPEDERGIKELKFLTTRITDKK
ncbi:MAG: tetratricopeptide repeat protein [Eubacteriales bacterium]|nr:tetratricopeptide repeat protein [Eubacteriales bacterium]